MPKYKVHFTGYASWGATVEAEDEEEAVDKAYDAAPSICAQCSGWGYAAHDYLEISDDWEADYDNVELLDGDSSDDDDD